MWQNAFFTLQDVGPLRSPQNLVSHPTLARDCIVLETPVPIQTLRFGSFGPGWQPAWELLVLLAWVPILTLLRGESTA